MMRAMKDSGVEWIGQIPADWEVIKLRFLCMILTGNMDTQDNDPNGIYPFYVRSPIIERSNRYTYEGEAILMAGDGVGAGRVFHYVNGKYACHQRVYSLQRLDGISGKFLFFYLKENFWKRIEESNAKSTVDSVRLPMLKSFPVVVPSLPVQQHIADYLDDKCGKIDAYVDRQHQIIDKLTAYKQSVITEAVTKGLDPTVPMKDSGVKWIGKIPADWKVKRMRFVGILNAGGVDKKIREDESLFQSIHYMDVYRHSLGELSYDNSYLTVSAPEYKHKSCSLKNGDVLFTTSSETPEDIGHSAVIVEDMPDILFGYHLMRLRPSIEFASRFEKYLYGSYYLRQWFEYRAVGMTRYGIANIDFSDARLIIPPLPVQQHIADYLDHKCAIIDGAIFKKQALIDKMEAYKKSLIYEVVTGEKEV